MNDHRKDAMSSALHPKFRATFPDLSLEVLLGMTSTLKLFFCPIPFAARTLILNPYQVNCTSANRLLNTLFSGTQPVKVIYLYLGKDSALVGFPMSLLTIAQAALLQYMEIKNKTKSRVQGPFPKEWDHTESAFQLRSWEQYAAAIEVRRKHRGCS